MKRNWLIFVAILLVHGFFLFHLRFTAWPEMLSYPYLYNNGFALYKDFILPYPPLLVLVLAYLFRIFGYKLIVLKLVTWLLILAGDLLIFKITKLVTQRNKYSFMGLMFYVSLQPFLEGNMLWFDLAIVLPLLLGVYVLIKYQGSKYLFWVGFWLALTCLIKQTTGIFFLTIALWLWYKKARLKNVLHLFIAPFILGTTFLLILFKNGLLTDFLRWNLVYPFTFWSKFPGYVQMSLTGRQLLIVLFLFLPLILGLIKKGRKTFEVKGAHLILILLASSLVLIYPRFSFFHSQATLAFLAIMIGIMLKISDTFPLLLLFFYFPLLFLVHRNALLLEWNQQARFYEQKDINMAQTISRQVGESEKVFFLGISSGLYVLSERVPPQPWTDIFGWYLEVPGVQGEIVARWEEDKPGYIYWQEPRQGNWYDLATYQPRELVKWIEENYTKRDEVFTNVYLWQKN